MREDGACMCRLRCTLHTVGRSLGQEEKECVSRAGSSHVTSSGTVRIRTES